MPRRPRTALGGYVFHVLNRAVGRSKLFRSDADFAAFRTVMVEAGSRTSMRLLSYCVMPNHWHLVLWPYDDNDLSEYMRWLTVTHTQRWHSAHGTSGTGPLYQGRFKSFPVESDDHFVTACRYVERNALRAGLVERAEDWQWSSLWQRSTKRAEVSKAHVVVEREFELGSLGRLPSLHPWPVDSPRQWLALVNRPQTDAEERALRDAIVRGSPFGAPEWKAQTAKRLGLSSTLRPRGRPRKAPLDT